MPLSSMIDIGGIMRLFKKAESGDPQATRIVRNMGSASDMTVEAKAPKAEMMSPGLASLPNQVDLSGVQTKSLPGMVSGESQPTKNFGEVGAEFPQDKHAGLKTAWTLIESAARGAQDPRFRRNDGPGYLGAKFQQEQQDALARRHQMWDSTYKASQELPPEVLSDPKFASLAQAKAALDKDMQDGKVDNEKNVSMFMTELLRFKNELKQAGQDAAVSQQLDMEGKLQEGRVQRGLAKPMEQEDYNFEGTPTTRSEYLRLSDIRRRDQLDDERMRQTAKMAADARATSERWRGEDRQDALNSRETTRAVAGVNALLDDNIKQNLQMDEFGKPLPPTQKDMIRALGQNKEAVIEASKRAGIEIKRPYDDPSGQQVWTVNGRTFPLEDEMTMLMYLHQILNAR